MGKITDIKEQARRPDRVSVYVDDKYSFSLTKDQALKSGLMVGQDLNPVETERLKDDSKFGKLRDNTFRWLAIRLRSRYEIEQYLDRKTEDNELKQRLLVMLEEMGYINDVKFAEGWIRNRILLRPVSQLRLKQELLQKRVPKEIIETALEQDAPDELAAAKLLIAKHSRRYKDRRKLMAYLGRQGFNYGTIKTALEQLDGERKRAP